MTTHSSVLAWRIPRMGEPGGLLPMGLAQSQTRLKRISSSNSIHYYPLLFIAPKLWPPNPKKQLIGKDPDAGKD